MKTHNKTTDLTFINVTLNIGLENNPLTEYDIIKILWISGLAYSKSRIEIGEYLGKPERTLVIEAKYIRTEKDMIDLVKGLCLILKQECIGLMIGDVGYLVYNPEFKGERFDFNKDYFINY